MALQAHEIDSNRLAFYRAGRDAGKRFLQEANKAAYGVAGINCHRLIQIRNLQRSRSQS